MKNPKFSLGIRIIAGCYLIYLAYQIIRGGILKGEMQKGSWQYWVALLGSIVFIIVGVIIAYKASDALMKMRKEEKLQAMEEAAEEAVVEVMQQQSSSERFRNMKSLADLEAGTLSAAADAEEIIPKETADEITGQTEEAAAAAEAAETPDSAAADASTNEAGA